MRAILLGTDGGLKATTSAADVKAAFASGCHVWVDLEDRTPETDALLTDTFRIHALTQEDVWNDRESPKVEEFNDYLYIVGHSIRFGSTTSEIDIIELDIILGRSFVITHNRDSKAVRAVADALEHCARPIVKGVAWVAHALLDRLVDDYLPIIDRLDAEIAKLEVEILAAAGTKRGPVLLQRIFTMKRGLQRLRRTSVHQRETLLRLGRGEFDLIPREVNPFFRDVYDQFSRITDLAESYRELLSSALEAYLSVQSNRMNEVMKTLTLMSTVMLPLTFIAGVYGMNFDAMPELKWAYGYGYALVLMAFTATGIVIWFRHKKWL